MKNLLSVIVLALTACTLGCDEGMVPSSNPPATDLPAERVVPDKVGVDVNLRPNNSPVTDRAELRQERRENIRDAINGVDVNVDGGKTKVDIR